MISLLLEGPLVQIRLRHSGVFDFIRELFSQTNEAKLRGYKPGRFSFNVKGGRCEACRGDGMNKIEMHFLRRIRSLRGMLWCPL